MKTNRALMFPVVVAIAMIFSFCVMSSCTRQSEAKFNQVAKLFKQKEQPTKAEIRQILGESDGEKKAGIIDDDLEKSASWSFNDGYAILYFVRAGTNKAQIMLVKFDDPQKKQ